MPAESPWSQNDFHIQRWGVAEGLPGNHVSALAQHEDGFLWLGTMAGLVRFDGVEFHLFNETHDGLPSGRISALDAGPSGRLWIGSELGHLSVFEDGNFRLVAEPGYPGNPLSWVVEDAGGDIWALHASDWRAGTSGWLWHWTGEEIRPRADLEDLLSARAMRPELAPSQNPGGSASQQAVLIRDRHQQVWALHRGGAGLQLGTSDPGRTDPGDPSLHMLGAVELTTRVADESIELIGSDGIRVATLPRDRALLRAVWLRDKRGLVWVSTIDGVEVHDDSGADPVARWELDSRVLDLIEDREGNIWVATRMRGIVRIQPSVVRQIGPEQGIPLPAALRTQANGDAVMAVQLLQPDGDRESPRRFYRLQRDGGPLVMEGDQWRTTDSQRRVWRFGGADVQGVRVDGSHQHLARHADWLDEDPSDPNVFWASSMSTMYRFRVFDDRDPVVDGEWPMIPRSAPMFDPDGGVWIGGAQGLHRIQEDRHRVFDRADGLPVSEVRALHPDGTGGLWLGTYGGGLVHFDGREFRTLDQRHGLVDNAVSSIVADDFGALWMSGNRGIQRLLVSDLEAFLDGASSTVPGLLFGTQHGLDNPEAVGAHSGVRVGDRLYFSTFGGLAVVNPAVTAAREQSLPQVHLLERSGDRRLSGNALLGPGHGAARNFEFRFTALHLSAPETLRYRHRLVGHDHDWISSGLDHRVAYTGLAPGEYRLRLQARHSGGPWVEASASPTVAVLPMWWETIAARVAGILAVLTALVGLWMLANRQVRQRAQALETQVAERTALLRRERDTVAHQARRLEELADGRARFIAGISHELRTPLTLIRGPLDALVEREASASAEMMQHARANVDRLQSLIDRLLESARLEAGALALTVHEVDLSDWLDEFAGRIRPLFDEHQSRLVMDLPEAALPAWIDPVLMESTITNLLVNALRHGSGPVTATLRASRDANGDPLLEVVDDGPGIAPEHRAHVFERFYRARGEQSRGSYGLGLWLVREIIERHHGTVELLDADHGGAHFRLRILAGRDHFEDAEIGTAAPGPAEVEFEMPATRMDTDASNSTPKDIPTALIVDDHAGIRALVRDALGTTWHVVEAVDGRDALDVVRLRLPDVIISDLMMPRIDGIELLRELRADPDTDFLPIVLLTARTGDEDRIAGLEQGADAYLAKPFSRRELRAVVDRLLARQKRLQARAQPDSAAPVEPDRPSWAPDDLTEPQRILVNRFQAAVEARLADEDLAVDDLAAALGQSRATLYRKLKQATNRSPSELIREIRLVQAHKLLEQGAGSVSEVGYAVGFRSVAHFSNAFLDRYGIRPSAINP